jgi:hypothetical protein
MSDLMIEIAKRLPMTFTKAEWYEEMAKRSKEQRLSRETPEQAFARYVTKNEGGQILFRAYSQAAGPDWTSPERVQKRDAGPLRTAPLIELEKMGAEIRRKEPALSEAQAFARAVGTPRGQELYKRDKVERLGISAA